jgi:hypothetical protein
MLKPSSRGLKKRGLIKRKVGEPATSGQFAPVCNFIIARGTEQLKKFEHVTSFREHSRCITISERKGRKKE